MLSKFLKTKEEAGNMILQADQSLSAAEQKNEGTILISCIHFYQSRLLIIQYNDFNQRMNNNRQILRLIFTHTVYTDKSS